MFIVSITVHSLHSLSQSSQSGKNKNIIVGRWVGKKADRHRMVNVAVSEWLVTLPRYT